MRLLDITSMLESGLVFAPPCTHKINNRAVATSQQFRGNSPVFPSKFCPVTQWSSIQPTLVMISPSVSERQFSSWAMNSHDAFTVKPLSPVQQFTAEYTDTCACLHSQFSIYHKKNLHTRW